MSRPEFEPLRGFHRSSDEVLMRRASAFREQMQTRRTVRQFSNDPVPRDVVDDCLRVAASAPSGANQQPWRFVIVEDQDVRRRIRHAAEAEEREFYGGRAPSEWLNAVEPFGTDEQKPFLEVAPILIAVFAESYGTPSSAETASDNESASGDHSTRKKHYYVSESVGIACGFLIAALHQCGLATLTHTPSPMRFLSEILNRPVNERAYLLLVAGYPAADAVVPVIAKKPFDEIVIRV